MDQKAIFNLSKSLGCCDACGLRYLGIRHPRAYENVKEFSSKFKGAQDTENVSTAAESNGTESTEATQHSTSNGDGPPTKKPKLNTCVTCLGLLQEETWSDCHQKVKEVLDKKKYQCKTFACALSAPIVTILREKVVSMRLSDVFKDYDQGVLTPLKEAWKWSYGPSLASFVNMALDAGHVAPLLVTLNMEYENDLQESRLYSAPLKRPWKWSYGPSLASFINMTLDAGHVAPLLVTLNMEYENDLQELEILKTIAPSLFSSRGQQRRRFAVEFTRRSAEQALEDVTVEKLEECGWKEPKVVEGKVECVSVGTTHSPLYLGGRYIKLSRSLPQTPWLVSGRRMMPSSVQEIIFEPIAKAYEMSPADAEHRLKFMSAGREDVDVRCLGDGRPFAIEVTDPRRELSADELQAICDEISKSGSVVVKKLVFVTKDDLTELKKGEQTKCKTYEALCVKLTHSKGQQSQSNGDAPITVTESDIELLNQYRNTPPDHAARLAILQKTPIRVLHRRPLLARERLIYDIEAKAVPDHPQLLVLRLRTSAGAYVKEAVHGELGRTQPALQDAIGAALDLLALDVTSVHLDWPR